jgi:hypothetical protein
MDESAKVEVLAAEVRVVQVGNGQITRSMYRQLPSSQDASRGARSHSPEPPRRARRPTQSLETGPRVCVASLYLAAGDKGDFLEHLARGRDELGIR